MPSVGDYQAGVRQYSGLKDLSVVMVHLKNEVLPTPKIHAVVESCFTGICSLGEQMEKDYLVEDPELPKKLLIKV